MIDATRDLTNKLLEKNYGYWLRKYRKTPPIPEPWNFAFQIPVTHTFGAWRRSGKPHTEREFPYRDILFKDRKLISSYHRRKKSVAKKPRRKMSRARKVKLDRFVFAYFGVHDPYYARSGEMDVVAFGAFIKTTLEVFPQCHATRRDLGSQEADWPPNREFLLPRDARLLVLQQVREEKRHRGDFWHYWGSDDYFKNPGYAEQHWHWKVEHHFYRMVAVEALDAILWPYEKWGHIPGGKRRQMIGGDGERKQFEIMHPGCKIIPYHWSNSKPTLSLVSASSAVTRYLLAQGKYPESADDAFSFFET